MIVLSLFNGMNTGRIALENIGVKVEKYYSSEIKPYAIKLTQHHHPDTIQLGDIRNWKEWDIEWHKIGLVLSGSPCQDLSIAGKRKGIHGENSGLFWVFIQILRKLKSYNPNVLFFQENVGSAPLQDIRIMSEALGVLPVRYDSNLLTAQNRDRYYWTNIKTRTDWTGYTFTDIPKPNDNGILLKDIIESGEVKKDKANAILESQSRHVVSQDSMIRRSEIGGFITIVYENNEVRKLSQVELERLQGFPDGWTNILGYNEAASLLGDGWTLPMIEHFFRFIPNGFEKTDVRGQKTLKITTNLD